MICFKKFMILWLESNLYHLGIDKNYAQEYSLEKGQSDLAGQGNLEASVHFIEIGTKCKSCTLKTDILCSDFTAVKIDHF